MFLVLVQDIIFPLLWHLIILFNLPCLALPCLTLPFKVTMSHDRFTLGVDCSKGDSVDVPNIFTLFGTKTSFEAAPYDTNRINAAAAAVIAANHNKPVEFSVGTQKSRTPPSKEEWERIIEDM